MSETPAVTAPATATASVTASGADRPGDVGAAMGAHAASMNRRSDEAARLRLRQLAQPGGARVGTEGAR